MIENPNVSIIISSKNEGNYLRSTIDSMIKSKNTLNYEIIVVDNASTDKSTAFLESDIREDSYRNIKLITIKESKLGVAQVRNIAAKVASGKYLFFCDAHLDVPDLWMDNLVNTLINSNADLVAPCIVNMFNPLDVAYGITLDKNFNLVWFRNKPKEGEDLALTGCGILCIKKHVFEKIYGFDSLYQMWGVEDTDLNLKAWLFGYKIVISPDVIIKHLVKPFHPDVVPSNHIFNTLCLAYSHFKEERLKNLVRILKSYPYYQLAVNDFMLHTEQIFAQREKYFRERIYNDDFFFDKFHIPF